MELNGKIYREYVSLDYHAAPMTPARRGADRVCTAAHAFLVTIGFNPACALIPRCWSWLAC
eukprot:5848921-Pyramimonas_sp.AAC.1